MQFEASAFNSYARGNLDDWFQSMIGDTSRDVDAGSSSFFNLQIAWLASTPGSSFAFGAGFGLMLPSDHALWGTKLSFGGRDELVLKPTVLTIPFIFRSELQDSHMALTLEPAMAFGWVTGSLDRSSGSDLEFVMAPGIGFVGAGGIEYRFSKGLSASMKVGYRLLKAALVIDDATSSTGQSQMTVNGENVSADLSGAFGTFGIALEI